MNVRNNTNIYSLLIYNYSYSLVSGFWILGSINRYYLTYIYNFFIFYSHYFILIYSNFYIYIHFVLSLSIIHNNTIFNSLLRRMRKNRKRKILDQRQRDSSQISHYDFRSHFSMEEPELDELSARWTETINEFSMGVRKC